MRWIIGIVVLVVVAVLGYQYFGARDVDVVQEVEEGAQQATGAVEDTAKEATEATEQAASEAAQEVQKSAEQVTGEVEGTANEATQAAQDTAEQAAGATQETAEQAAEATQQTAEQAGEAAERTAGEAAQATEQAASNAAGAVESATEEATEGATAATESATEQAGEAAGAMQESLTEAQTAALTVGDVNVGEQVSGVVSNLETSLAGVTDAASAEAALPTLTEINTKLEGLSSTVGQLPEDAKKILADFLNGPVTQLKSTAESVMNQEGVGDVLRPALEPIMATLESWAQQPA